MYMEPFMYPVVIKWSPIRFSQIVSFPSAVSGVFTVHMSIAL